MRSGITRRSGKGLEYFVSVSHRMSKGGLVRLTKWTRSELSEGLRDFGRVTQTEGGTYFVSKITFLPCIWSRCVRLCLGQLSSFLFSGSCDDFELFS